MTTEIVNLKKQFGTTPVLHDINLKMKDGEFLAILGPSGCGKTTLLRLLAGFESPTAGEIYMEGKQVANAKKVIPPEERNVSMVFQSFALWPHLTVSEHVKFALSHHRFADRKMKEKKVADTRAKEVLQTVGLGHLAERMPGELSGGQKQRVSLARAIAPEPKLLLMDEPLSNLDAELRMEMRHEIQKLHRLTKASILYVTHDQGEALAMADRIVVMNDGRIEQIGTPEEIYYYPETPFVATFVGKANLFSGKWNGDSFRIKNSSVIWEADGVSKSMKEAGVYPLRPEQIQLSKETENKLTGKIVTKQFQGKEYHYSIEVAGEEIVVHQPIGQQLEIGEEVALEVDSIKSKLPS